VRRFKASEPQAEAEGVSFRNQTKVGNFFSARRRFRLVPCHLEVRFLVKSDRYHFPSSESLGEELFLSKWSFRSGTTAPGVAGRREEKGVLGSSPLRGHLERRGTIESDFRVKSLSRVRQILADVFSVLC
jgi:hypothetical protein